ncbi:MAG: hypothetical protein JOY80_13175, partial [Candidatus Dormibacteraeota bacterium]|nr:hypothetical protein [Candidatus Dormibacteraeota bacterium]
GHSLVKQDPNGKSYTFAGSLGIAPQWENGTCDQNCQELVSACLMAHINSYGVHYPIWIDAAPANVGWGLPPSTFGMEAAFFGNIMVTGNMNHGNLAAPLGYFCRGDSGFNAGAPGRVGDFNIPGVPPYYDTTGGGTTCGGSGRCTAHTTNGVVDGYTDCADGSNNRFYNPVTLWRDLNGQITLDATYVYGIRPRYDQKLWIEG